MNRTELIGRLIKDPEIRKTKDDLDIASFTIAINRQFKKENGEQETDFIPCKAFKKRAETIGKYLKKGDLVGIEGSIRTGSYEKDGQKIYTTEIFVDSVHFLSTKANSPEKEKNSQNNLKNESENPLRDEVFAEFGDSIEISDDEIAF